MPDSRTAAGAGGSEAGKRTWAGKVFLLALWAVISHLLGLVRDLSIAWLFGAGWLADALVAATVVPHALRKLLADGVLSLPFTAAAAGRRGSLRGRDYAPLVGRTAVWAGLILLAMLAGAPLIVSCLAPGSAADAAWAAKAAALLRCAAPYAFFALLSAPAMGLLHARGAFSEASAAPVCFNLVILCCICGAWFSAGQADVLVAAGFAAGGMAQTLLLWFFLLRGSHDSCASGPSVRNEADAASQDCQTAMRLCRALTKLPGVVVSCSSLQLCFLSALAAASLTGEGVITSLYFADRILELPAGIVGACMGIAALPDLTREAAAEDRSGFMESLRLALHTGLLFALPAACGLFAVAGPLVSVLLGHGNYTAQGIAGTVLCLQALIPALPACIMLRTLVAACHAWGMDRLAVLSTLAAAAGAGALGIFLTYAWGGADFLPVQAAGPLSACAALWIQAIVLLRALAAKAAAGNRPYAGKVLSWAVLLRLFFCGLTAGLSAAGVLLCCLRNPVLALAMAVAAGGACWLLSVRFLCPADFRMLFGRLRRHRRGK